MKKPEEPTQEEFEKVARWQMWVKVRACSHSSGLQFSSASNEMTCPDCGDPLFVLSETQIEEMKEKHNVE